MEEYKGIVYQSAHGELKHWGIKGMRWGVRRYQNPDGSLTPLGKKRKTQLEGKQAKTEEKLKRLQGTKDKSGKDVVKEPDSEKRDRALKSSDPKEIFKNKDLLTTQEIKERLDRIDTEKRLAEVVQKSEPKKKTAMDRVDSALKWGKKANEVYEFTNSALMKQLMKNLGFTKESEFDAYWKGILKNSTTMSDDALKAASARATQTSIIKKLVYGGK